MATASLLCNRRMNSRVKTVLQKMSDYEAGFKAEFAVKTETGLFLYQLVKERRFGDILELGTWRGASAIYLAAALQEMKSGQLTTVNLPHEQGNLDLAKNNFVAAGLEGIINLVEDQAANFLKLAGQKKLKYDLIFIDADKAKSYDYVVSSLKVLTSKGIIIIDDIISLKSKFPTGLEQKLGQMTKLKVSKIELGNGLLAVAKK